jgi:mannose-6-phosphate isomerase-like protein (cupin superfamily)
MVNWARLPVGKAFSLHYHEDMQEIFVVFQGEARITVGEATALLRRGDAVLIDPGEVHEMRNVGNEDVEYLALGITAGTGGRTIVVERT